VRGFHALVYGGFLPEPTPHVVLTSLPVFSGITSPRPFVDEKVHRTVLATLCAAELVGKVDRVQYWDGQCGFRCVWVDLLNAKAFARCVWRLDVPGPQDTRDWWGWYDLQVPPAGVRLLDESDVESYNNRE
jgi:hypothetical protein